MGWVEQYMPVIAMVGVQFMYSGMNVTTKSALLHGMSPSVFIVYRHIIATFTIVPVALLTRRKLGLTWRSFGLIFLTSLLGLEKVEFGNMRSLAKMVGTAICVTGALSMVFLKGPKFLNSEQSLLIGYGDGDHWLLGCLCLLGSNLSWSIWLILQVPLTRNHSDLVSLTAWMCFLGSLQCAILTYFFEPNIEAWRITSNIELVACFFSGIIGSAVSFFIQAWCISQRGPLFSAMFNPLGTVIVTFFATIFLQEELFLGSSIGAIGVIIGLYIVLWGKAEDMNQHKLEGLDQVNSKINQSTVEVEVADESLDLEKPLLSEEILV